MCWKRRLARRRPQMPSDALMQTPCWPPTRRRRRRCTWPPCSTPLSSRVYLPYAQWLVEQDRFEEAQAAFKQAGQASRSLQLLRTLTHNAVLEHRYHDAGHYLWTLAKETLANAPDRLTGPTKSQGARAK